MTFEPIATMTHYSDWANNCLMTESAKLNDQELDRPFDMGLGSLRRTIIHIYAGESVWLARWKGQTETPWVDETNPTPLSEIRDLFSDVWKERDALFASLTQSDFERELSYRDSKGEMFTASLGNMIIQGFVHSIHHRAQAVNMLRRLGGEALEMDFMAWIRKPAQG